MYRYCSSVQATLVLLSVAILAEGAGAQSNSTYRGICDASAAVALDNHHFVVADDELNVLRVYRRAQPDPVGQVDLTQFLGTKKAKESDLEGAAAIGNRIFWISSHGTNSEGVVQDRRRRLFATEIVAGEVPSVRPVGKPYASLVDDLSKGALGELGLAEAAKKPPKTKGALNIEGLAATPDGKLIVGFRNPIRDGKALLVPITNPDAIVAGDRAVLGQPMQIDLDGRGIRSIDLVGSSYLIVAGPIDEEAGFDLYRWSGDPKVKPEIVHGVTLAGLNPEALFAVPASGEVQILSDDGTVRIDGRTCKDAPDTSKSFRSIVVAVPQP